MNTRISGGFSPPPIATTVEEFLSITTSETSNQMARAANEVRHLGRELRSEAQRQEVSELRSAADSELWASVASGVGQIVASAATIVSASHSLGSMGGAPQQSDQLSGADLRQAQSDYASRISNESSLIKTSGELVKSGADIGSAFLKRDAAMSQANARERASAADAAQDIADSAQQDLEAAHRASDKATDALRQLVEEQRRTQDAATRA